MNNSRRNLLVSLAAVLTLPVFAIAKGEPQPVDVVKVMSFSCSFCLAAESHDRAIEAATKATGGRFVRAPVPSLAEETSARDMSPEFGERVKTSMYKGAQEAEVPLLNFMQVYTWVTQDLASDELKFAELFKRAQGPDSLKSLNRALSLATNAGVSSLPTYVLLVKGDIKAVLDNSSSTGSGMSSLRNSVTSQIETLSKPNANIVTP